MTMLFAAIRSLLALLRHCKIADGHPVSEEERSCSGHRCNDLVACSHTNEGHTREDKYLAMSPKRKRLGLSRVTGPGQNPKPTTTGASPLPPTGDIALDLGDHVAEPHVEAECFRRL